MARKQAQTPATQPAAAPAPAAAPQAVALRGGPAITLVALTGKQYRVGCSHNSAWWQQVQAACASGPAPVATLLAAGVPAPFVGYTVRRGYLKPATA